MLRPLLIAGALLTASGAAFAHSEDGYGRVVAVEPHFVISLGSRHPDGFRVLYESGGSRYWMVTPYRPAPVIVLPQHYREYRRGWDERRDWRDRRGHHEHRHWHD